MKFKEWFNLKLEVNSFPYTNNERFNPSSYNYVINVSDEYYLNHHLKLVDGQIKSFWFPMNEGKRDIGLNSIYGAMIILYQAEKTNSSVYLHCHAGVNRSQLVRCCYYYMRTGQQYEPDIKRNGYINQLYASCQRGYLPPVKEIESFLSLLGKYLEGDLQKNEMMGGMLDTIKLETINNF